MSCVPSEDSDHLRHLISLRCPYEESLGPQLPIEHTAKTDQTGQMPSLCCLYEESLGPQLPIEHTVRTDRLDECPG